MTVDSRPPGVPVPDTGDDRAVEIERILSAAVRVMERCSPDSPKVSDIVVEAGTCNKTFYRHFSGKDDLLLAVLRRGTALVAAALATEMAGETRPELQVTRWIEGLVAQVSDPRLFTLCRATLVQMSATAHTRVDDEDTMTPLRDLLTEPLNRMGRPEPVRDADAVYDTTMGTLRRYIGSGKRPPAADVEHLVRFCLGGLGVPDPGIVCTPGTGQ